MTKPIVIETTDRAEGVLKTDIDAWKRGPSARDALFKSEAETATMPEPPCDKLEINDELGD